ncbi:MAG: alpha-2-macroglobulin, partial [Akkermansiaceae bacterium]
YDNKVVIAGDALGSGEHKVEIKRKGEGPLYTNAYLTVFTKEDFIKKAGLEVKVDRAYYKLERIKDARESTAGTSGQVVDHKVEKHQRIPLNPGDTLTSGDLVEVELHIHSKNDYEYLMFNDWKPAGLEAVEVRSGYISAQQSGMHTYMEMRNEKTSFFVRQLARGSHSVKYRLRAEIPGSFSALPTMAEAMYAPELKANSDEMKIRVKDR